MNTETNPIHAAHTPGPWVTYDGSTIRAGSFDGPLIATIEREHRGADAALIADAPRLAAVNGELVTAMEACASALANSYDVQEWPATTDCQQAQALATARAALAKATGGAQ